MVHWQGHGSVPFTFGPIDETARLEMGLEWRRNWRSPPAGSTAASNGAPLPSRIPRTAICRLSQTGPAASSPSRSLTAVGPGAAKQAGSYGRAETNRGWVGLLKPKVGVG